MLTVEQKEQFERDGAVPINASVPVWVGACGLYLCHLGFAGYLVLENFTSVRQLAEMRRQAVTLVDEFDPETVSVFSTKNQV